MIAAAAPLRFLRARVCRGTFCRELTLEAVEAWVRAKYRDERRDKWVGATIGEKASPVWRALGLYPQRIIALDYAGWSPALEGEGGAPAIIVPQWDVDIGAHASYSVVDLVAVDPRAPALPIARYGRVEALGEIDVERALYEGVPIVWHADALSWLRAGGNGERYRGEPLEAAHYFPFVPDTRLAERVLLEAVKVIAGTHELGEELDQRQAELRRACVPPRVEIFVASADLET